MVHVIVILCSHIWRCCCSSLFPLGQLFMHGHQDNSALHQQILTIIRRSIYWIFFYFYVHVLQFDWVWLSHILLRKYCVRCATRMTNEAPISAISVLEFSSFTCFFFSFLKRGQRKASASAKVRNQSCSFDLCSIGTRRKYGHPFQYSIPLETLYKERHCTTIVELQQGRGLAASTFCPAQKHPIRHLAVSTATIRCSHDIRKNLLLMYCIPINASLSKSTVLASSGSKENSFRFLFQFEYVCNV